MVDVKIGGVELPLGDVNEGWVTRQINRRRQADEPVCVQVRIDTTSVKLRLVTPDCGGGGGGGRALTPDEQKIVGLWRRHHLDTASFTGGDVVACLKQLERLV